MARLPDMNKPPLRSELLEQPQQDKKTKLFFSWQGSDRLASDATWTLKATGDETKSASATRCTELVLDMSILSMSLGTCGPSEINSRNVLGFACGMHDERTSTCGLVGVLWFLLKSQDRIRTYNNHHHPSIFTVLTSISLGKWAEPSGVSKWKRSSVRCLFSLAASII